MCILKFEYPRSFIMFNGNINCCCGLLISLIGFVGCLVSKIWRTLSEQKTPGEWMKIMHGRNYRRISSYYLFKAVRQPRVSARKLKIVRGSFIGFVAKFTLDLSDSSLNV
uniref:Uncharacterized protein n=1 Tax=Glossina pallidipes TaxID=7398 RepID=A0A1A9Z0K4_GLOPL